MKVGALLPWSPKRGVILGLALALASAPLWADQSNSGVGSQAASFLTLASDARSSAMGQAGTALPAGAQSLGLNPAGLAGLQGQQLSLSHNVLPLGATLESAEYGVGLGRSTLGLDANYVNLGTLEKSTVDASGNIVSAGTVMPYGYDVGLAWGLQLLDPLALGVLVKAVGEDIGGTHDSTVAGDLGLLYRTPWKPLSLGLALQNLGGTIFGSALPLQTRAGLSYSNITAAGGLSLSLDAIVPSAAASQSVYAAGLEWCVVRYMRLRAGYQLADQSGIDGTSGLSLGAGFSNHGWEVDYAWVPRGDLGSDNQFSFSSQF
jgi:hypothetical protein